jgi:hypothetical protein
MMTCEYGNLDDRWVASYLERLVGCIFKILPLKEESCSTYLEYLDNIVKELIGVQDISTVLHYDARYISIVANISFLLHNGHSVQECRRVVFQTIHIIKQLQTDYPVERL